MKTFLIATVATLALAAPAFAQEVGTLNVWGARLDAPTVIVVAPRRVTDVTNTGSLTVPSIDRSTRRPSSQR